MANGHANMKEFYHPDGRVSGRTLTAGELIKVLSTHPPETPVFAEWEGVYGYMEDSYIDVTPGSKWNKDGVISCLVFDVNDIY